MFQPGRMSINKGITLLCGFLLLTVVITPTSTADNANHASPQQTPADEGDHFPMGIEWWWLYTTLTLEDGRQWDMCIMFFYQMNWSTDHWSDSNGFSYIRIESWDRHTGGYYDYLRSDPHPGPFHHEKNCVNLSYYNSTLQGLFPYYTALFKDETNNITMSIFFNASAPAHFIGQEAVNGSIPFASGYFRYWLTPLGMISGRLTEHNQTVNVTGIGYMEHMYADTHLYDTFFRGLGIKNIAKISSLYMGLSKWMFTEYVQNGFIDWTAYHTSTDSIVGYDWIWIGFPSGWSMILYRVTALATDDGPSIGLLIVTNGTTYWEFADITTRILRDQYLDDRDVYLPMDFEISAGKGSMKIHVLFQSTTEITKMYFKAGPFELGNFLVAGVANGTVTQDGRTISLGEGKGTNTPMRFIPRLLKHVSNDIDWIFPPEGLGIVLSGRNHYLYIEYAIKIVIQPIFDVEFTVRPSPNCPLFLQRAFAIIYRGHWSNS
jgi:hypothetical protein